MKLKALSHYAGDIDTRFGDCILLYDATTLIVYDCGNERHAEEVEKFLKNNSLISEVHVVISHNDEDHTKGVITLFDRLYDEGYDVTVYSSLYLKSAKKVLDILDDDRRTLKGTKERILKTFDHIKEIVEKAQEYNFTVKDAAVNTKVASGSIVGPTEDEFVNVVAQAVEDDKVTKYEGETVMNAASVQLKCKVDDGKSVLLCGDATPAFLHNLNVYGVIQLPHHGKLDNAQEIFDKLTDSYSKIYLISDNTGSGPTSGGSDKLVEYMKDELYDPALNTKNGVVNYPKNGGINVSVKKTQGVKLGGVDTWF